LVGFRVRASQLLATLPAARKLQVFDVGAGVLLRELEDPQVSPS
jgi:hypothetical protein